MQRVFFITVIIIVTVLMLSISLNFSVGPYKEPNSIKVSLVYQNESEIYELEAYSTLDDLLELTGKDYDFEEAKINRNQILAHRDVIHLPERISEKCISVNTGTKEELMTLKGVGEKSAIEIIEFRSQYGNFNTIDDLTLVKGVGASKLEIIRESVCL